MIKLFEGELLIVSPLRQSVALVLRPALGRARQSCRSPVPDVRRCTCHHLLAAKTFALDVISNEDDHAAAEFLHKLADNRGYPLAFFRCVQPSSLQETFNPPPTGSQPPLDGSAAAAAPSSASLLPTRPNPRLDELRLAPPEFLSLKLSPISSSLLRTSSCRPLTEEEAEKAAGTFVPKPGQPAQVVPKPNDDWEFIGTFQDVQELVGTNIPARKRGGVR